MAEFALVVGFPKHADAVHADAKVRFVPTLHTSSLAVRRRVQEAPGSRWLATRREVLVLLLGAHLSEP